MKPNGKKLGVLGGMGPAAAAEFLRLLAVHAPAHCDQEHPVVYLLGDASLPDRSTAMLGLGESPAAQMKDDFFRLAEWGADLLCAPCNSAHYFIDSFREELPCPLIHIIEETLKDAAAISPQGAWLIGTDGTIRSGLYQRRAKQMGYNLLEPLPEVQKDTMKVIAYIKAGDFIKASDMMKNVVQSLRLAEELPIVLACTELPLAYAAADLPKEEGISSLEALAKACVRELYSMS